MIKEIIEIIIDALILDKSIIIVIYTLYEGWELSYNNYFFLTRLIDHEEIQKYTNGNRWY